MTLSPKERFSAAVADYVKYRPSYPSAVVEWLSATTGVRPPARVVDLGSGTGISSRLFAAFGFEVTGVEPNDDMRAEAEGFGGGVRYVKGEAAATALPAGAFDLAIAAQAFHWFDVPGTIEELQRILRSGGWASAFWNVRASTPFLDEYKTLLESLGEYNAAPKPEGAIARIEAHPAVVDLRSAELENAQQLNLASLIGRAFSSSYVVHASRPRAEIERELQRLFETHARDGVVEMKYRVVLRAWRISG